MIRNFWILKIIIIIFSLSGLAQTPAPTPTTTPAQIPPLITPSTSATPNPSLTAPPTALEFEEVDEGGGESIKLLNGLPSKRRIRRHLNLITGIKHDEEILIPDVPLSIKGAINLIDIQRIKGTDVFRVLPKEAGDGIITIHNKKTGQIYVDLRLDIRPQNIEKAMREIQALLADIEGIEYKIANNKILLDGFVLLPKDLKRIGNIIAHYKVDPQNPVIVTSLVSLSPLAKKRIVEYISRDINNPEVQVTSVGDFIRLEGVVNTLQEKQRIQSIAELFLPDIVNEKGQANLTNLDLLDRKPPNDVNSFIINLIQIRKEEDKEAPPPKMIQIVMHVVEYSERYLKGFNFTFSPSLQGLAAQPAFVNQQGVQQVQAPGSLSEIAAIVDNLLPKLNWAKNHGYIKLLDTASILMKDKADGGASISRSIVINTGNTSAVQNASQRPQLTYNLELNIRSAEIKTQRSELVELALNASTSSLNQAINPRTDINTTVSVRSRQSAALAGIIQKKSENQFGGPTSTGSIISLNHGKEFVKNTSNYVMFITPIVKASASSGVEQVKKKFRLKE